MNYYWNTVDDILHPPHIWILNLTRRNDSSGRRQLQPREEEIDGRNNDYGTVVKSSWSNLWSRVFHPTTMGWNGCSGDKERQSSMIVVIWSRKREDWKLHRIKCTCYICIYTTQHREVMYLCACVCVCFSWNVPFTSRYPSMLLICEPRIFCIRPRDY